MSKHDKPLAKPLAQVLDDHGITDPAQKDAAHALAAHGLTIAQIMQLLAAVPDLLSVLARIFGGAGASPPPPAGGARP